MRHRSASRMMVARPSWHANEPMPTTRSADQERCRFRNSASVSACRTWPSISPR
jgi:hypothetical protein